MRTKAPSGVLLFFFCSAIASSLSEAMCHACGWLAFVFSARCVFLGVCLCTLGCQPSIILAPSGLCVGLFHQHHHLLVFYSGPQGYNDCTTFQICSSSPSDWLPYPKSGSYFLSVLYSLAALQLKMVRTWADASWAPLTTTVLSVTASRCWIGLLVETGCLKAEFMGSVCCPALHMCEPQQRNQLLFFE